MNVVVFGATGGTGRTVLRLAGEAGHRVTAFARNPAAVTTPGVRVAPGDVEDAGAVADAVEGADAVVSALGIGYSRAATTVYSVGTAHIVAAMRAHRVRRLLCVSTTSMARPSWRAAPAQRALTALLLKPLLRRPYRDMARMESIVRTADDLDWTLVRAARLTAGQLTGRYRMSPPNGQLPGAWSVSRADLACCLVQSLEEKAVYRSVVEIAY
ncbi:NAD(P)H-binding protein [Streptomyces sp. NPDC049954]|uniref:NAD(P)-dependent oxidoreductase n=1 Tax=Streptomyces sp. NPDC049954 TaxID=3155779 RepID=UPI00343B0776